jgi:phage N-6-adenine-methyltransferase
MIINSELARSTGCDQKDLWETPDYIFKPLDLEFDFTLDPCCTLSNCKAGKCYTVDQDGLSESWAGQRVFCNPPYSRGNIDNWVKKCYLESLKQNTLIVGLLPVSTSANWWHEWVWKRAELRYIKGRVRFVGAKHTAPFSSVIAIWASNYKILTPYPIKPDA